MACIKNIGCYPSCEGILFPYEMLETGVHTISFGWLGVKKSFTVEGVEGEKMTIPNVFNESSDPIFSIRQPSGTYLCWDSTEEELAECPDDCGEDCDYYKKFSAEIIDTGVTQSSCLPKQGESDQIFNITSSQVIDNGNDTYTISVIGSVSGAMAWDELYNVYEFNGQNWVLKASVEVTTTSTSNTIKFDNGHGVIHKDITGIITIDTADQKEGGFVIINWSGYVNPLILGVDSALIREVGGSYKISEQGDYVIGISYQDGLYWVNIRTDSEYVPGTITETAPVITADYDVDVTVTVTTIPTRTWETVVKYNVYTDDPTDDTLLGEMTPTEASNGKDFTISEDAQNIHVTTVWDLLGESTVESNIVSIGADSIENSDFVIKLDPDSNHINTSDETAAPGDTIKKIISEGSSPVDFIATTANATLQNNIPTGHRVFEFDNNDLLLADSVNNALGLGDNFTMFLIYSSTKQMTIQTQPILGRGSNLNNRFQFSSDTRDIDGRIIGVSSDGGGTVILSTDDRLAINTFEVSVIAYEKGVRKRAWINGVIKDTETLSGGGYVDTEWGIGTIRRGVKDGFDGHIAGFYAYDRILSDQDIVTYSNELKTKFGI